MARRLQGRRRKTPRRLGDWFTSNVAIGPTAVAATVLTTINLLSAFDEPVTVVRILGSIWLLPQSNIDTVIHWAIYLDISGDGALLDPSASADISKGEIMHWGQVNATATPIWSDAPEKSAVDIKVKRKMRPESIIRLGIKCAAVYDHSVNLRSYVLLA